MKVGQNVFNFHKIYDNHFGCAEALLGVDGIIWMTQWEVKTALNTTGLLCYHVLYLCFFWYLYFLKLW